MEKCMEHNLGMLQVFFGHVQHGLGWQPHQPPFEVGNAAAIKSVRNERPQTPYILLTIREYRLPCPLRLQARTTTSMTSQKYSENYPHGFTL